MLGMNKAIRFVLWFVGALVVFGLALLVALKLFIDPNDYREEIAALVEDSTGRTLTIEGDLDLQVFPCCGVRLGPLELSNPPGYDSDRMLRVENAAISVRLLPLILRQELAVGMITLEGLDLALITRADGSSNMDFTSPDQSGSAGAVPEGAASAAAAESSESASLNALDIDGIRIADGRLRYVDEMVGDDIEITALTVESGAIVSGESFPLSAEFTATGLAPDTTVQLRMDSKARVDLEALALDLSDLQAQLNVTTPDVPGGTAQLEMRVAEITGAGAATTTLQGLDAAIAAAGLDVQLTGNGAVTETSTDFNGRLVVQPFAPQELLKAMGEPPMVTADPQVLQTAGLSAVVQLQGDTATLSDLAMQLDDTNITGSLSLLSIERQAAAFDLQIDAIDADRYMEPVSEAPVPAGDGAGGGNGGAGDTLDLPVEDLRALDVTGRLRIAELRAAEARLTEFDMQMVAKDGVIQLAPLTANLYGGTYADDITLNVQGDVPRVSLASKLRNFALGEFLADTEEFENLTGLANLTLNLRTRGNSERAMTRNLNGRAEVDLEDGRYTGTDIWYEIRAAKDRIKGDDVPPPPAEPYTDISEFRGSARITDGVAQNDDFRALIPFLQLDGAGAIDIVKSTMDYRLEARVTGEKEFSDGYTLDDLDGVVIPVKLRGDMAEPKVSIEVDAIINSLARKKAEEKLFEKLGLDDDKQKKRKNKGKNKKDADKSTDPKEQLKRGIRDLFNK